MARSILCAFGAIAALSLVGCSTGKDSGSAAGEGEGEGEGGCTVTITETVPSADAGDFFYQSNIEVVLSEADSTATVTLADDSGAEVAGSTSTNDDGTIIYFNPDSDLAPSTGYSISISTCSGAQSSSVAFATSELGTPIDCDLSGKTFRVDLASARFVQPDPAVASLLFDALEDDILIGVADQNEASLSMLGALSEGSGGPQNYCYPSIEFPTEADFNDPAFSVGPADTTIDVADVSVTISNLGISGAFAPDCTYFGGGRLTGELDARVLGPLVGELLGEEDPDAICSLLTTFGVTCGPCSSDGAEYCAQVEVDQIAADSIGAALSCVSGEECHPLCTTSTCEDPITGSCD